MTSASPIGSLAARLRDHGAALAAARQDVDDLLVSLFPGWRPRFPLELGWKFVEPNDLEVFEVLDSDAARGALALAGFTSVVLHPHPALAAGCRCRARAVLV